MRLIGTIEKETLANRFAEKLKQCNIEVRIEPTTEKQWESDRYGDTKFLVWVINEDDLLTAKQYFEDFQENSEAFPEPPPLAPPPFPEPEESGSKREMLKKEARKLMDRPNQIGKQSTGILTFYLIALCTVLFLWIQLHTTYPKVWPSYIPPTVAVYPKLEKDLLFDYPAKLAIADRLLVLTEGPEALMEPETLSSEERTLLEKYETSPYWQGIYPHLLHLIAPEEEPAPSPAPRFEKIREGQFWRIFTPALLHADIFHLLFNMLWLAVLGTQIESRIGFFRYLLLILLSGICANLGQYLMSGYNFLGFSGIICGMIAFIWMRKRRAPWEGYLLQRSTVIFISIFIFGMLALQIASFAVEAATDFQLHGAIANTAHIVGGAVGALLAATPFGRWKS